MKILFLSVLLVFGQLSFAATTKSVAKKKAKEVAEDKVYTVEKTSPEIIIGTREALEEKNKASKMLKRPSDLWHVALVRSGLNYHLPSTTATKLTFSPAAVGLIIGGKIENHFFFYKGYYEIAGEWQRFKRESTFGNGLLYSQNLDLYQINFYQNFNVAWAFKHSVFFSVGVGLAPIYLTTEQSVFSNSSSELGYMGMLKGNIVIPVKKMWLKNNEIDIAAKIGWGNVGSHEVSTAGISLGMNFE